MKEVHVGVERQKYFSRIYDFMSVLILMCMKYQSKNSDLCFRSPNIKIKPNLKLSL